MPQWPDWTSIFPSGWANKVPPPQNCLHSQFLHSIWHIEEFLAIFDGFLYLDNLWGKTLVAHPLVNSESCYATVLNWVIWENIRPVELAQYGKIRYWASSNGHIISRIAQLRTLAWQLLRFTRKYSLSWRIYYSIVFKVFHCLVIMNSRYCQHCICIMKRGGIYDEI